MVVPHAVPGRDRARRARLRRVRRVLERRRGVALIEFRGVSKRFADGTLAVEHFDLVIPSRKTTVFVGSSGSGKTTLLRMINRMVDPTAGQVLIDGEDVATRSPVQLRRSIGYVMQNAGLMPHFTVERNIGTVLALGGAARAEVRERSRALMATVGLDEHLAARYPSQLSGGQQQRVGVARALAADPYILLMDEPFGAVDPIVRAELQHEVIRLQRELDKTVVFVTHDIDEAFLLGDQVVILERGGVIAQLGSPSEIIREPATPFVAEFIGADRGSRALRIEQTPGGLVVVDTAGRTQGRIVADAASDAPSAGAAGASP